MTTAARSFNTWDWQREINRRCGAVGVGFKFDPKATTAYTDGRSIVVPTPPENATTNDYTTLRGQVIHECGHIARSDAFKVIKEAKLTAHNPLFMIYNQLEDRIQEHACVDGYIGDAMTLDRLHTLANEKFIKDSINWKFESDDHRSFSMRLSASMFTSMESAKDWMPQVAITQNGVRNAIEAIFGTEGRDLVAALEAEGWANKIRACRDKSPYTVFELAKELYTRLFPELPPPPEMGKGAEGDGGKGKGEGKAEDMPDSVKSAMGKMPWELLLRSAHEDADGKEVGGDPVSIDWEGKPRNKVTPLWYKDVEVKTPGTISGGPIPEVPHALIGDVRRELQAKTKAKVVREKLHGRLDRRNLTRLVMPQVGDGTYNRSVFQQLTEGLKLNTAVTILVDCSGSMRGEKFTAATQAAISLYDLCGVALRLPCEVLAFTHSHHPQVLVCKSYAESRLSREVLHGRLNSAGRMMSGNSDGDALMVAFTRQLQAVRNPRKIIIVLSDGCPVEAGNGDGDATLRAAVAEIRSKGTELYGIGIMDQNVRRYYSKKAPVVSSASDISKALLEVLRDVLQRQLDAA